MGRGRMPEAEASACSSAALLACTYSSRNRGMFHGSSSVKSRPCEAPTATLRRASANGPDENGTHKTAGGEFDLQGGAAKAG